jgi:hypothetical protein
MPKQSAAQSAIQKLEKFYAGLKPDEQKVISLIVSSSLQRAARAQAERDWLKEGEILLDLVTPDFAPRLVAELGRVVAGQAAPAPREGAIRVEKRPLK